MPTDEAYQTFVRLPYVCCVSRRDKSVNVWRIDKEKPTRLFSLSGYNVRGVSVNHDNGEMYAVVSNGLFAITDGRLVGIDTLPSGERLTVFAFTPQPVVMQWEQCHYGGKRGTMVYPALRSLGAVPPCIYESRQFLNVVRENLAVFPSGFVMDACGPSWGVIPSSCDLMSRPVRVLVSDINDQKSYKLLTPARARGEEYEEVGRFLVNISLHNLEEIDLLGAACDGIAVCSLNSSPFSLLTIFRNETVSWRGIIKGEVGEVFINGEWVYVLAREKNGDGIAVHTFAPTSNGHRYSRSVRIGNGEVNALADKYMIDSNENQEELRRDGAVYIELARSGKYVITRTPQQPVVFPVIVKYKQAKRGNRKT